MTMTRDDISLSFCLILSCAMALLDLSFHPEAKSDGRYEASQYLRQCIETFDVATHPEILPLCQSNADYIARNAK